MPSNPNRATQGGDVPGTTKTDVSWGVGAPTSVARASYEPGYSLKATLEDGGTARVKPGDLLRGYCDSDECVGDAGSDPVR